MYRECKTFLTTEKHIFLLCNRTEATQTTTYSATTSTTTSRPATTTELTTHAATTHVQEKQESALTSTTTLPPMLRGSTTKASKGYNEAPDELGIQNRSSLGTFKETRTSYIYVSSNQTKAYARPEELTAVWIAFGILLAMIFVLTYKLFKPRRKEMKRRRSIQPVQEKKNRNSWSNEPYRTPNPLRTRRQRKIPKEHRKSMEAVRKQLNTPKPLTTGNPIPPVPPRPAQARMQINEIGVSKLQRQMGRLREIQKKSINDTPHKTNG